MLQQERFVTVRKPSLWLVCGAIDSPSAEAGEAPAALRTWRGRNGKVKHFAQ